MKVCSRCQEAKPLDSFHRDKSTRDGRVGQCKACKKLADQGYFLANRDHRLALMREYAKTYEPPEHVKQYRADYQRTHAARYREHNRRRRVRVAGNPVAVISDTLIEAKLAYWGWRCWMCRSETIEEMDHVKPVARGGAHLLCNLRPTCRSCNRRKATRWPLS